MKKVKVLPVVLLLMGMGIGVTSLYEASVAGLMRQVGLVGADFRVTVEREEIERLAKEVEPRVNCGVVGKAASAISYMLGSVRKKEGLAFTLGEERVKCGITLLSKEKVKEGTYEIVKGLRYLSQGYELVEETVKSENDECRKIPGEELKRIITKVLAATTGKVYEIIGAEWEKTKEISRSVEESCFAESREMR